MRTRRGGKNEEKMYTSWRKKKKIKMHKLECGRSKRQSCTKQNRKKEEKEDREERRKGRKRKRQKRQKRMEGKQKKREEEKEDKDGQSPKKKTAKKRRKKTKKKKKKMQRKTTMEKKTTKIIIIMTIIMKANATATSMNTKGNKNGRLRNSGAYVAHDNHAEKCCIHVARALTGRDSTHSHLFFLTSLR